MRKVRFFSNQWLVLFLILLLGLGLRLYKIKTPLADHHSWRQADTAAVARNFIKEGFDFLRPRIDNMAPLHPGELNSGRLFLVEPPIYQAVVAVLYRFFGVQERLARLASVIFSLGAIVFLYFLVKEFLNQWVGLLASFFMAVLPFSVFYSRVILPESLMLFAFLGMLYFFGRWIEKEKGPSILRLRSGQASSKQGSKREIKEGILAWLFTALALSLKTFPLFLILPMLYLAWREWRFNFLRQKKLWVFAFLAILPLALWRFWISQHPQGIPGFEWLFNQGGIRFRPAFFRWIFAERIGKLILGYWGLPLFALGLLIKPGKKEGWFFHWCLIAFLAYVTILASGNVTHDYYQIPFVPIAAIFLAKGSYWLLKAPRQDFNRVIGYLLLVICCLFAIGFSWYEIRGFYLIQGGVDLAGQAVDELTPEDALVLTGDSNDATLLYNCNRYGWTGGYASYFPNTPETIEKVRKMGATVYVTTEFDENSDFGQYLLDNYSVIKQADQYIIFSLAPRT